MVEQQAKKLAARLNKLLDEIGVPDNFRERTVIFSKMLHAPKQQIWAVLEGHLLPDETLLEKIAAELEVDREFLLK